MAPFLLYICIFFVFSFQFNMFTFIENHCMYVQKNCNHPSVISKYYGTSMTRAFYNLFSHVRQLHLRDNDWGFVW